MQEPNVKFVNVKFWLRLIFFFFALLCFSPTVDVTGGQRYLLFRETQDSQGNSLVQIMEQGTWVSTAQVSNTVRPFSCLCLPPPVSLTLIAVGNPVLLSFFSPSFLLYREAEDWRKT